MTCFLHLTTYPEGQAPLALGHWASWGGRQGVLRSNCPWTCGRVGLHPGRIGAAVGIAAAAAAAARAAAAAAAAAAAGVCGHCTAYNSACRGLSPQCSPPAPHSPSLLPLPEGRADRKSPSPVTGSYFTNRKRVIKSSHKYSRVGLCGADWRCTVHVSRPRGGGGRRQWRGTVDMGKSEPQYTQLLHKYCVVV